MIVQLQYRHLKLFIVLTSQEQSTFTTQSDKMQHRLTSDMIKKMIPIFQLEVYNKFNNKKQYISDLFEVILHKRKINNEIMCMNEFNDLIQQIKIPLKNNQLHQLYLYSTYQRFDKLEDTKKKLIAMVNQEKHKVDIGSASQWIQQKIQSGEIKILLTRAIKSQSQHIAVKPKNAPQRLQKLPPLRGTYGQKLQQQLKYLIQIFEQMQRQRQSSGLIPLNQNQDQQIQIPNTNIPYDPQLYTLNNCLSRLRIKAEDRLARIIELAKSDKRIRIKLQEAIQKFQKQRIEANQKVGRIGAMKAYKRVVQRRKDQVRKIRNLKLGEEENLVKATHLHALLNFPEIKSTKIIY